MNIEQSLKNGGFCACVPRELEIEGRPELSVFPFNVLFMQHNQENGKTICGSAIYEPDLESLQQGKDKWFMRYHNVYGGDNWLVIEYDTVSRGYHGKKIVNGKSAWTTDGPKWDGFFTHFTMLGLADGERCKFEAIG